MFLEGVQAFLGAHVPDLHCFVTRAEERSIVTAQQKRVSSHIRVTTGYTIVVRNTTSLKKFRSCQVTTMPGYTRVPDTAPNSEGEVVSLTTNARQGAIMVVSLNYY